MKTLVGSVALVVTGTALVWGVNTSVSGVSVNTIGGGLILIGLIVAFVGLLAWARRDGFTGPRRKDETIRGT